MVVKNLVCIVPSKRIESVHEGNCVLHVLYVTVDENKAFNIFITPLDLLSPRFRACSALRVLASSHFAFAPS